MVSFRRVADKMLKRELIQWAEKRLNLILPTSLTKTGMGSRIMVYLSDTKIMPRGQATQELQHIYYLRTGKNIK